MAPPLVAGEGSSLPPILSSPIREAVCRPPYGEGIPVLRWVQSVVYRQVQCFRVGPKKPEPADVCGR